ncbi:MAG: methyltransferase [Calditrichaeota bacterium]|nr:methyltransferase [Calditrichota bacterium]
MTSRERVRTALAHRAPDKVPIDFGSTGVTGMHVTCVAALRDYYGLEKRPVKVHEPYQMLGWIDEDLQQVLGIDVEGLYSRTTMFGFPNENWREFRLPWGQVVLVSEHFRTSVDQNGDLLIYPEGDTTAPPSGRMPVGGFFFDTIVRQPPIVETQLNPEDNLEEFVPVSAQDLDHYRAEVRRLRGSSRAVVASFGGTAFGDIALVPAPFLKYPKGIRDIAEWYVSTVTRQDYLHQVFARQAEVALANLEKIHAIVGDLVDVVFVCGTDFGTQTSSFCSVATFRSLYAPYYKRVNDWIHQHTSWKTFKHSCGAVEPFIEAFLEVGFDILNPVQCSAAGMDPVHLKRRYGDRIVFWGGGVDTQKTLPFASPAAVREEVLRRCEVFGRDGGYVFNAVHNIQANTPVENIVAMFEAVKEFNGEH